MARGLEFENVVAHHYGPLYQFAFSLTRNEAEQLDCDEKLFWQVVKAGFNQRRKTLRNALSSLINKEKLTDEPMLDLRAERLSVDDFVNLTNKIVANR